MSVCCVKDTRQKIVKDSVAGRVAWESCGTVVNVREERDREETAKIVVRIESGGGWNIEDVAATFGDGGGKLLQNRFELFGDGKGHEEFDEVFFPCSLGPGGGVGRRRGTDENIRDEEVAVDDAHIVHGDGGG